MDTASNEPPSNPSLSNQKRKIEKNDPVKVKRTRFCQTYHRQSFPFRAPIMKYISMNPTTPKVYQKLIHSCKHFFFQNSVLIIPKLYFTVLNGWHTIENKKIFDLNNVSIRLWVTEKIRVDCKPLPETCFVCGAPTIYKDDAKKLVLLNNKIFFENYISFASNREEIYLENVAIINEDDSIVPLEKMIEVSPNIKDLEYKINELSAANIILPDTVKKLIAIPHFCNLTFLSLKSVPENFDMESFFAYVKKNRKTEIWLWFQDDISEAYLNRLQEIVDEIISPENREYRAPWIYFDAITEDSNDNFFYKVYLLLFLIHIPIHIHFICFKKCQERRCNEHHHKKLFIKLKLNKKNAERARKRRAEQTQEQKVADNERKKQRRQQLTAEQKKQINAEQQQRTQAQRSQQTEAERAEMNETQRQRTQAQRAQASAVIRAAQNAEQRERTQNRRSNFDENQARAENAAARLRMQMKRNRETKFCAAGFEIDDNGEAHYGGPLNFICDHCGAKHFANEKVANKGLSFYGCCQHGTVKVEIPDYPEELKQLFDLTEFRKDIRVFNNAHAFGSFNADVVNFGINRPGPYTYIIQGQSYYQINTALRNEPNQPKSHGQLYIVDPEEAVENRLNVFNRLNPYITKTLSKVLSEINAQAKAFQMLFEQVKLQIEIAQEMGIDPLNLTLHFGIKPGQDQRRFNLQASNEVAAVFGTNDDGEIPDSYITIFDKDQKKLKTVNAMDPNVEPWLYPIFFPTGKYLWHPDLKKINSNQRLTRSAYAKYMISIRDGEFNEVLHGGRLFQQWLVDTALIQDHKKIQSPF